MEVFERLAIVLELIEKNASLGQSCFSLSRVQSHSIVIGLESSIEITNPFETVSLAYITCSTLRLQFDNRLKVNESLLKLLHEDVDLTSCLVCLNILGKL